jgi:hypothetical protein
MLRYRRLPSGNIATLGDAGLYLEDSNGQLITGLGTGHTFSLTIYDGEGNAWFAAKTTGITGQAGSYTADPPTPNIVVAWAASGELQSITKDGIYEAVCEVIHTASGKRRNVDFQIEIYS